MYKRILFAYDGSESGQRALLDCKDLARGGIRSSFLVAVMPSARRLFAFEGGCTTRRPTCSRGGLPGEVLADGLRRLPEAGHRAGGELRGRRLGRSITAYARRVDADLIVVGHKHLDSWTARWWRGSTSRALIEHAHCSVLVVITH